MLKSPLLKTLIATLFCILFLCCSVTTVFAEDPALHKEAPVFNLVQDIKDSKYNSTGAYALVELKKSENPYEDGTEYSGVTNITVQEIEISIKKQLSGRIDIPDVISSVEFYPNHIVAGGTEYIVGIVPRTEKEIKSLQGKLSLSNVGEYNINGWYVVKKDNIYNENGQVIGKVNDLTALQPPKKGERIPAPTDDLYALKVLKKTMLYKGQGTDPVRYAYAGDVLLTIGKPDAQFIYTSVFFDNEIYEIKSSALQHTKSGEFQTKKADLDFKVGIVTSTSYIYKNTSTKNKMGSIRKGAAVAIVTKKGSYYKILTQDGYGYVLKANIG